jgi:hypothetical protein
VHTVSDVRQIKIRTAKPLVPGPSLEVEIAILQLKKCKPPGSDQIAEELIQAGIETSWSVFHKLIGSVWNQEEIIA